MTWEKILKTGPAHVDLVESIEDIYSITREVMDELLPKIREIDFGSPEAAQQWAELKGGLLDLEGTVKGFKEVHDYVERQLGAV